ncbi:MAG: polysaccharide biosynthesis protein [Clostridiales bacterium]|nr:polysaccharide biosynthesis protein [Clostridiales bacterium]
MITYGIAYRLSLPDIVWIWAACNAVLVIGLCLLFRLYTMVFASVGFPEAIRMVATVLIVALANALFVLLANVDFTKTYRVGYSLVLFYSMILLMGLMGSRFLKRIYMGLKAQWRNSFTKKKRVMLVGFNSEAFTLIRNMSFSEKSRYRVVCVLDEDKRYLGKRIYDVRVVGTTKEAKSFARKYKVQEIFIAIPSLGKAQQREIIQRCSVCKCPIRMLSEISQLPEGAAFSKLRPVAITDLLGRDQVSVNLNEVMGYIEGKTVLVTGGGGSIGSELCRQIALHSPKLLIIFDIYENNVYDIEQELRRHYPDLNLLTLIGSIRDKTKVWDLFEKYRPQIVFNAAAHKHVPLMETSPNEAVKNNVFGTLNVAKAADEFKVQTFVQISTDKAVNPTNIMGATKRICEMIIQTIGKNSKHTKFVAVRFGNVLGSNGSVIPLFKKQIEEGGPVTVTHKDIIRYFMTIPEAVSLVLQAGAYAQGGQIFVLDMGEPVKIYDLAYNLIKLSGYEPNVDIEIKCTGLRPGEKLYEERLMAEEGLQKTPNGLINIAKPIPLNEVSFWGALEKLREAVLTETDKMKEWVKVLVPTYTIDETESAAVKYLQKDAAEREIAAADSATASEGK